YQTPVSQQQDNSNELKKPTGIIPSTIVKKDIHGRTNNLKVESVERAEDGTIRVVVPSRREGSNLRVLYEIEDTDMPSNLEINEQLIRDRLKEEHRQREREVKYAKALEEGRKH